MPIESLCPSCAQALRVDAKFAGRRTMCPLCEGSIPIPGPGQKAAPVRIHFLQAIEKFKISDWDKIYCKLAVSQGFLGEPAVRNAVIAARKRMRSGHGSIPVGDILVNEGKITPVQNRQLKMTIAKSPRSPGKLAAVEDQKACPNCFENIPAGSKKCPYCAEILADLRVMDMCPNCKNEQAPGGKYCLECGADIETGLIGGMKKRKCPKCGLMSSGTETICPVCHTPYDMPSAMVVAGKAAKNVRRTVRNNMGYVVLAGLVLGGLWAYKHRQELWTQVRSEVHGVSETQLQDAVSDWISALKYQDISVLNEKVDRGSVSSSDIASILGHNGQTISEIMEISVSEIRNKSESSATAYVDTKIRIPKADSGGVEGIEAMAEILQGGEESKSVKRARVSWNWVKKDGTWFYVNE